MVTRGEAERRGATTVAEALSAEPTLQVNPQAYGYLGNPSGIQLQGVDGDRVLILEDGEPTLGDVGGMVDLAQLSLMDTERIEIVQGPMSSLYGTNALGGVVNVISAPPRAPGLSFRFREQVWSYGELFAETGMAHRDGKNWQAFDASFHGRQGVLSPDESTLSLPERRLVSVGVRTGLEPATWLKLRFKTRWMRDATDGFTSRNLVTRYFLDSRDRVERFTTQAQSTMAFSSATSLNVSLRKTWYATQNDEFFRGSPDGIARQRHLENQSAEAILTFADGPDRTWVFGMRHELQEFEQFVLDTQVTSTDTVRRFIHEVEPRSLYTGALYAQLGWRLFERWTLMPGVRAETHGDYDDVVAPRLALAWQIVEELGVRAAVGRGFRVPSPRELGLEFDHASFGYIVEGDQTLKPEQSWGITADATLRTKRVRVRVGAFANWISDLIDLGDEAVEGSDVSGTLARRRAGSDVSVYRYENFARVRTAGADVSVRFGLDEWLSATAGYSYLWTRDDARGEPLPARPDHTATLTADTALPLGVRASMQYKAVSGGQGFDTDEGDGRTRAFSQLNARVALPLWPSLEAYVGVQNLGDEQRDAADVNDLRPALGRTIYFGFKGGVPGEDP